MYSFSLRDSNDWGGQFPSMQRKGRRPCWLWWASSPRASYMSAFSVGLYSVSPDDTCEMRRVEPHRRRENCPERTWKRERKHANLKCLTKNTQLSFENKFSAQYSSPPPTHTCMSYHPTSSSHKYLMSFSPPLVFLPPQQSTFHHPSPLGCGCTPLSQTHSSQEPSRPGVLPEHPDCQTETSENGPTHLRIRFYTRGAISLPVQIPYVEAALHGPQNDVFRHQVESRHLLLCGKRRQQTAICWVNMNGVLALQGKVQWLHWLEHVFLHAFVYIVYFVNECTFLWERSSCEVCTTMWPSMPTWSSEIWAGMELSPGGRNARRNCPRLMVCTITVPSWQTEREEVEDTECCFLLLLLFCLLLFLIMCNMIESSHKTCTTVQEEIASTIFE